MIIHNNTDTMVCPECEFNYPNCDDFEDNEGVENCVNCGNQFAYVREIFVVWNTENVNT